MTTNPVAFRIGAIIGALVVGALLGLIPLFMAKKQGREQQGWIAFGCTLLGGLVLGVILALPVSIGFCIYLAASKKNDT